MKKSQKKVLMVNWANMKIHPDLLKRMQDHKKKTFIPIVKIAEVAITKYLDENQGITGE